MHTVKRPEKSDLRQLVAFFFFFSMNPSPSPSVYPSSSLTILLIIVLIAFFVVGFFLICLCRFLTRNLFNNLNSPTVNLMVVNSSNGLEPSLVQSFPTFMYSTVKEIRQDTKYGLECAICLSEFEEESMLRLLTVCYHVFHKECVDLWLESHKTCPVCRRDLDLPPEKLLDKSPQLDHDFHNSPMPSIRESNELLEDAVSINIEDDEREDVISEDDHDDECCRGQSTGCTRTLSRKLNQVDRLPRSNSTGHSKGQEKYTLRISDSVKFKIVRGHTGSCITFGEFSDNNGSSNGRFGEVSGSLDYGGTSKT